MLYFGPNMDFGGTLISYGLRLGLVLLLVLANGFFVAAEFALVGVRRSRVATLAASGNKRARRLLEVLDRLDAYISATQLGITIASLGLGWVGESTLAHLFEPLLLQILPLSAATAAAHTLAIALAFGLITFLHIVLGELAPKSLALQRAESVALAVTPPMVMFHRMFRAPIWVLNAAGNVLVRMIGLEANTQHAAVYTTEELHHVIDLSQQGGQIKPSQQAILARALEFSRLSVRAAMVPRSSIEAVSDGALLDEIVQRVHESGYSRLPVYHETPDNIIGIIHSKEVLAFWHNRDDFSIEKIMHPVNFVPDTMRLDAVLRKMQEERFHFAIVTDEHGGFEGIITLEDLLEEIVGEIEDEFDEEGQTMVQKLPDGSYLLEGTLPVRSANRRLGLGLPEEGVYHTLAGFLMTQAGRVLRKGDRVEYGDAEFSVEDSDRHRIRKVKLIMKNAINASVDAGV
ncbi:MAG: hemolysin family protein [Acidobacteriota bacterium]